MTRSLFKDSRRPYFWAERRLLDLGLSVEAFAVYCVLAAHVNAADKCWPSYGTIARSLGVCRRTVIRAVRELIDKQAIRKHRHTTGASRVRINCYELVDLPAALGGGDCGAPSGAYQSPTGDSGAPVVVTPEHQELGVLEQGEVGSTHAYAYILEAFLRGFKERYGYRPRVTDGQKQKWDDLCHSTPEAILQAKIDAWWDYQCPRLSGNRTFGAFLQWFDDIPHLSAAGSGTPLTPDQKRQAMLDGTALGRRLYAEAIGSATDHESKQRTLVTFGYASNAKEADDVINACEVARP